MVSSLHNLMALFTFMILGMLISLTQAVMGIFSKFLFYLVYNMARTRKECLIAIGKSFHQN